MNAHASRKGVNFSDLRFFLHGEGLPSDQMIADNALKDGDQVDVFLAQIGC